MHPVFTGYSWASENEHKAGRAQLCVVILLVLLLRSFHFFFSRCGFYRWTKCVATGENLSRWLSPDRIPLSPGYQHIWLETGWSESCPHLWTQSPQQLIPSTSLWGKQNTLQEWLSCVAYQEDKFCIISWQGVLIQLEEEVAEVWLDYRIEHCSPFSYNENSLRVSKLYFHEVSMWVFSIFL